MALEDQVRSAREVSLPFDPGTQFAYSGMGYEALGDIIAKVSGQSYEAYIAEYIFAPLDIGYNSYLAMLRAQSAAVIVMTNFNDLEEFVMPAFLMRDGLLDIVLQAFAQK